jgi:hypothetical protein
MKKRGDPFLSFPAAHLLNLFYCTDNDKNSSSSNYIKAISLHFGPVLFGICSLQINSSASEIAILIDLNYNFGVAKEKLLTLTTTGNITSKLQDDNTTSTLTTTSNITSNLQDYNTTLIVCVTGSSANHMETLLLDLLPSIEKFDLNAQLNSLADNIDFNTANINRIPVMAPILAPILGVHFFWGHISIKNGTFCPLFSHDSTSFKNMWLLI